MKELIDKVKNWSFDTSDFHSDRQLADEILLATGWNTEPYLSFEGGIRWYFGTCPQVSVSDAGRPHPLLSMDAALGCLPQGCEYSISTLHGIAHVDLPLNSDNCQTVRRDDGNVEACFVEACLRYIDQLQLASNPEA